MSLSKNHVNKHKLQSPYQEKDLQGKICRWLKDGNAFNHVAEVKITTGGTLNFNKFEPQQLPSLVKASSKTGKYYKLTDASVGKKPFDYICPTKTMAFVVCQFWKNKQQELVYFINIKHVMNLKNSGLKALKEEHFLEYGFIINLADYKVGIKKKTNN